MPKDPKPLIVALDLPDETQALTLVKRLDPGRCRLKVGKELFTRLGPAFVERLQGLGFEVFLDLKFHDIPHTVAAACRAAADLGVWMLNVHVSGGPAMLAAARAALDRCPRPPLLIGVTVLTSLERRDLEAIGCPGDPEERVLALARLALDAGLDGVVCSPREVSALRAALGQDLRLVTPGIRMPDSPPDDQRRTLTPPEALIAGADYLVIGRPITQASDPLVAFATIERSITQQGD